MSRPLVVICLDGAGPDPFLAWAQSGSLPTLSALLARGAVGTLTGAELVSELGVWTSVLSGVSRSRHGYYYFRQLVPGTYDVRNRTGEDAGALPFWAHLREGRRRALVVDVPDTRLVPGLDGIQLANWATHTNWNPARYPVCSEPPGLAAEVVAIHGPKQQFDERHANTLEQDRAALARLLDRVARKGALCRELARRAGDLDLAVVGFGETHAASHQFFPYSAHLADARPGPPELVEAVRSVAAATDRELGLLLAELPRDANVVVIGLLGIVDKRATRRLLEQTLQRLGHHVTAGGVVPLRPLDLLRRSLPGRVRAGLSARLPRQTRESLLADSFRSGTDWQQTTACPLPSIYTGMIRINLRGREPEGIVPPERYVEVLDALVDDLQALTEPGSAARPVEWVGRTAELFGEIPLVLPDLFVSWRRGPRIEAVAHPRAGLVTHGREDFDRRGEHDRSGFVVLAGPDLGPRGTLGAVRDLDVAPTLLHLLGIEQPPELTGRPLAVRSVRATDGPVA